LDPRERALSSSDLRERVLEPPPIDGICSGLPPQDGKVEGERVDYRREGEGGEREWREESGVARLGHCPTARLPRERVRLKS